MEDACPLDTVSLRPQGGCSCWCRTLLCSGQAIFGFLPPGAYVLTLARGGRGLRLRISLPPGGNVLLRCCLGEGRCCWRQDGCHYFFNTL